MDSPTHVATPELVALQKVISLCDGNRRELIRRLRALGRQCSDSIVWTWENRDLKVSVDFVLDVARAVDWRVTPHELSATHYPHPEDGLPAELRARAAE